MTINTAAMADEAKPASGKEKLAASDGTTETATPRPKTLPDGSVVVPGFTLPFSSYASKEARQSLVDYNAGEWKEILAAQGDVKRYRQLTDEKFYLPLIAKQNARYSVVAEPQTMAGVYTEVFTPKAGVSEPNRNRVLINLHGGGFVIGARTVGRIESIPIAATARIKVVSVDYRQGPENRFPAASEDVASVYRELLKTYKPNDIGIYGCSAGGLLTAQSIAWFQKEKLPLPAAIGIFCASTHGFVEGDSGQLAFRTGDGIADPPPSPAPKIAGEYFEGASAENYLVAPHVSRAVLARFPPTLLVTGSRSFELSGATRTQIELTLAGVEAKLSVWDGMLHAFFFDPDLPESREAYQVIAGFFNDRLGKPAPAAR